MYCSTFELRSLTPEQVIVQLGAGYTQAEEPRVDMLPEKPQRIGEKNVKEVEKPKRSPLFLTNEARGKARTELAEKPTARLPSLRGWPTPV